nr:hypothetical protein Q903MT_gene2413 [Picea sitchensis]
MFRHKLLFPLMRLLRMIYNLLDNSSFKVFIKEGNKHSSLYNIGCTPNSIN